MLRGVTRMTTRIMNGTMPVIEVTQPMTPLLDNIQLKDIDMIKVKNITNSATMNCKVEPTFVRLITSNCSCSLCNGMYLIDSQGKVNQDACPCYTKRTAYSTLLLALNLKLTDMKSGKTYEINNHCDFAFQTSFLMTVCRAKVSHDHLNANVAFMNDLTTVCRTSSRKATKMAGNALSSTRLVSMLMVSIPTKTQDMVPSKIR